MYSQSKQVSNRGRARLDSREEKETSAAIFRFNEQKLCVVANIFDLVYSLCILMSVTGVGHP